MRELSLRTLNRTLLVRQHLAARTDLTPYELIRHLVAVQGQEPNWPYIGAWSRLERFDHKELATLMHDRKLVRSTTIRRTVHLSTAEDFRWLRPTVQAYIAGALNTAYYRDEIDGIELPELAASGREVLAGRRMSRGDLGRLLAEHFPQRHTRRLAEAVEVLVPMAHGAETGEWGRWRNRYVTVGPAEEWIGAPLGPADPPTMILRYLAAFGPASVADIQAWSGLTRLGEVVDPLRPRLRVLRRAEGAELLDLPDAPLADPELPVPVRFLPAFDNALLGYRDRRRIIADEDRRRTSREASAGVPVYLVDGFVHGRWSLRDSALHIEPWYGFAADQRALVEEEARRLLAFMTGHGAGDIVVTG
ncbi:winged helix DNA-binding domain-containing protein [Nocardia flavorosea]|uniref:Winged helix DNA-binding domain-containing protein n=1 Tax=Nocardia flavorosea TaxID=53429 RepID=A0A846YRF9_9NOCA|nr:winged helix DNA-binding domain-containing protein [Nocardia flavorosea]NKY59559.1 winged helix DNA-binding domain-containing protein [Nocardia flavorosea]